MFSICYHQQVEKIENGNIIPIPFAKRVFDVVVSVVCIVGLAPFVSLILLFSLLERVFFARSRVPFLYKETRISQGKPFTIYKFRTFKKSLISESVTGTVLHTKVVEQDFRNLTIAGMIFIQVYLDEYPQLFLVLSGKMSFVGPRPTNPEVYQNYIENGGRAKTILRAGLTGRFQTHKSKKYGLNQEEEDIAYADFVATHSGLRIVLHDTKILLQTIVTVLRAEGI